VKPGKGEEEKGAKEPESADAKLVLLGIGSCSGKENKPRREIRRGKQKEARLQDATGGKGGQPGREI